MEKYLEYAGDPWMTDYAELRPLMEDSVTKSAGVITAGCLQGCCAGEVQFDEISHESVDKLEAWRESGQLAQVPGP